MTFRTNFVTSQSRTHDAFRHLYTITLFKAYIYILRCAASCNRVVRLELYDIILILMIDIIKI